MELRPRVKLRLRNKDKDIIFETHMTQEEYVARFGYYIFAKPTLKERIFGRVWPIDIDCE